MVKEIQEITKLKQECQMNLRSKFIPKVVPKYRKTRLIKKLVRTKSLPDKQRKITRSEWAKTWSTQIKPEMKTCSVNQL